MKWEYALLCNSSLFLSFGVANEVRAIALGLLDYYLGAKQITEKMLLICFLL